MHAPAVAAKDHGVGVAHVTVLVGQVHDEVAVVADLGPKVGQGAVQQDRATVDDDDAAAEGLDVVHIVGGEDDGDAALAVQSQDEIAHGELGDGIEADGGLVEEQDGRGVEQRRRQIAPHALAQAELARRRVEQRAQVHQVDQLVASPGIVGLGYAVDVAQQIERFDDGQVPPQLGALAEHDADVAYVLDALAPGYAPENRDVATVGHQDAAEHLHGGGLAGAVGPDIADEFAGVQRKRDVGQRLHRAVAAMHDTDQRSQDPRGTLGDAERLGQVLDDDLRHGASGERLLALGLRGAVRLTGRKRDR